MRFGLAYVLAGIFCVSRLFAVEPELYPIDKLKSGMLGSGTTIFSSVKGPESFEFKILGVMRNFAGPGQDLVIAEMLGERFEKSGVVAGMSGSPAFVDGKLLGAVSYGFGDFSTHAIAGITPINNMLTMTNGGADVKTTWGTIKPISLPLVARGLSPSVADFFKPKLAKLGYDVISPSAGVFDADGQTPQKLVAGGPIAAVVIDGDMSLAAIGTVTWIKDDAFVAFGHPFWQTGKSELPVATADIVTTIFSPSNPYKMGQAREVVGALTDDRQAGIGGKLGLKARMTPVHVSLGDRDWNFRIGRHPTMTSMFTSVAIANSLAQRQDKELGGTYRLQMDVDLSTGDRVHFERHVSAYAEALENVVGQLVLEGLTSLMAPNLKVVQIEKVDAKITYRPQTAITDLLGSDFGTRVKPGGHIHGRINHKPWQQPIAQQLIDIVIPQGLSSGDYEMVVADRSSSIALEFAAGLLPVPQSYSDLVRQIKGLPGDTQACVYIQGDSASRAIDGVPALGLPPTLRELTSGISVLPGSTLSKKASKLGCIDLGRVVRGVVRGVIRVERR